MIGVNSRLDSIQAAILRIKLRELNGYTANRQKAAEFYDRAFADIPQLITPARAENSSHVFHQYTLRLTEGDRDKMVEHIMAHDVPAMIYYPVPLHHQKAYTDPRYNKGDFPVTERLCEQVFSLPMHSELDEEQLTYITDVVKKFFK
jgi:dTDP-4-amino-4,6-dideoxygalactose transaminase